MAVVHIRFQTPKADGTLAAATGALRFTPTARRTITGAPDTVVLPASFQVQLVDGVADVTLEATTAAWVWQVDEYLTGTPARTIYVQVNAGAEYDYTDLTPIDPATLLPAAAPEPAWVAMANSTVTTGTVTGDNLILTRTDGTTVNAGNVRGAAGATGATGATGPANTLGIGSVTTGAAGTAASAIITGTAPNQTLSLTVPKGDKGDAGPVPAGTTTARSHIRPKWDRVYRVGTGKEYPTIADAIGAAKYELDGYATADPNKEAYSTGSFYPGGRVAFSRAVIVVDPGTYTTSAAFLIGNGVDLIGATGNRDDVVIQNSADTASAYVLQSIGSMYVADVTLKNQHSGAGKSYIWHGDVKQGQRFDTTIFDNVHFINSCTGTFNAGYMGYDMGGGDVFLANSCRFSTTTAVDDTVLHDMEGAGEDDLYGREPRTSIWLNCQMNNGNGMTGAAGGTYNSTLWRVGCTKLDGTPHPSRLHKSATVSVTVEAGTVPPLPYLGMNPGERTRYYPTAAKSFPTVIKPEYPDLQPVTLVANRIYYIPLPVMSYSALVDKVRLVVTAAAGNVGAGLYVQKTPAPGKPNDFLLYGTNQIAAVGRHQFSPNDNTPVNWLYGGEQLWLGVIASSATAQLLGSTQMSRVTTCYYQDGETSVPAWPGTLTAVPAGDVVPYAEVLTK